MNIINIATYRFVTLPTTTLPSLRDTLKKQCADLGLKGTILLSEEGINLFVAGYREAIEAFKTFLDTLPPFQQMTYKESLSATVPFKKLFVKIKKEIIRMDMPDIQPEKFTAPHLAPEQLKQWYDEGKDMVVLDTRNDYEYAIGTFENAVKLDLKHFRNFPEVIENLPEDLKNKPIVTFCTGGIRCEKAAAYMVKQGFKEVYQLDGGILNYFEKCGSEHYEGECFVFDDRITLDANLAKDC